MQKSATVAVISPEQKLLILRRGPTAPWMPGRYCLPGGKIEPNEDHTYAASRELSEETGISYPVDELKTINIKYNYGYEKIVWIAHVDSTNVILNWEHDDYKWITQQDAFVTDLVPGLSVTIKTLYDRGFVM